MDVSSPLYGIIHDLKYIIHETKNIVLASEPKMLKNKI
jgi:hypothetical protein